MKVYISYNPSTDTLKGFTTLADLCRANGVGIYGARKGLKHGKTKHVFRTGLIVSIIQVEKNANLVRSSGGFGG